MIPFQGSFGWRYSPTGNLWTLTTKEYELVEPSLVGETLRRISIDHDPVPVSEEDVEVVREAFPWFINLGGTVDWARIPDTTPAVVSFFSDNDGNLRVNREAAMPGDEGRLFDLFNPDPIVRDGILYGVTTGDLGAANVVRARIEKPQQPCSRH